MGLLERARVLLFNCRASILTLESAWHWLEHDDVDISSIKYFQDID